jgi:type I restriction-modification system DNA methylase subunit
MGLQGEGGRMNLEMENLPLEGVPLSVNNRSLFTDYYLKELFQDDPFFQSSKTAAREAWDAIKAHYEKVKELLPRANEAETECHFIHPVLDILGYKDLYSLKPPVPSPEGVRRPDFAFFATREDLEEAEKHLKGRQEYFAKALVVGDAKQWERSLDRKIKGPGDPFTNQNPSYQIDFYLRATDRAWGILTNGRHWRLYHKDTSYRMTVFYEIDLPAMLEGYDDSFLYFYAFFCKEALTSGFLDRAYKQSQEYVAKLGDELKENVYEALRLLAEGFLKFPGNGLSEADLEKIRANTFVLIYRLLFILYAEDRGLLPRENPSYRSYSLRKLAGEIAERLDRGEFISPATQGYWARLHDLFRIVNLGDDSMGVPPYNGGLFDENKHPFLEEYKVGDLYLAKAIDQLARAEASGRTGRGPVSYRDLEIRHIGAIYEGLLEHHLRVADWEIAVIKEKGHERFIPISELDGRKPLKTYQSGEVYLETDKGERKATGSYYTPHYIVQYIVRNTLEPLIEEKREEIKKAKQALEEKVKHSRGYNRDVYERQLRELNGHLIDEILSIKVLDPAMGSGHFLVEATDFLAKELIRALGESPDEVEEDEARWARREVVERCIFGVDLNLLAVELAKLSLWLYTVAKDRPLSFLDHHLRLGNSLIGAWVKELGALPVLKKQKAVAPGQIGLFEGELKKKLPVVIGQVLKLLRMPSDKVEQIRQKEEIYGRILEILRPFKEVADIWTSVHFGNEVEPKDYEEKLLLKLSEPPAVWESEVRSQPWFVKAQEIAEEKHFFHWELEFPEVFYQENGQRKENPGFDVVLGNPPYVRQEQLKESKDHFRAAFTVYDSIADLYVYFYEISHRLLRQHGRFGMITSNKFMRAAYGEALREYLTKGIYVKEIIDFGDLPVFPEASAYPCILLTIKADRNDQSTRYLRVPALKFESLDQVVEKKATDLPGDALAGKSWRLMSTSEQEILEKMERISIPLKAWLGPVEIRRGVLTGFNEAFFIDEATRARLIAEDPKSAELIKPLIIGEDVKRYEIEFKGRYLIWTYIGVPIEKYPAIFAHLKRFQPQLEKRWDKGEHWWELRHCDYYGDFEKPKIVYQEIAKFQAFAYDWERLFCNNKCFIIPTGSLYLLATLNSSLIWSYLTAQVSKLHGDTFALQSIYVEKLPIRRISFTTPKEERARLVEEGKRLYLEALERLGLGGEPR